MHFNSCGLRAQEKNELVQKHDDTQNELKCSQKELEKVSNLHRESLTENLKTEEKLNLLKSKVKSLIYLINF